MTDGFWQMINAQLEQAQTAKTAAEVLLIFKVEDHNSPAFFAGSGGDGSVMCSLIDAGWSHVWTEASYYWAMRAPDGSVITYIEGDIFEGNQRPLPHNSL